MGIAYSFALYLLDKTLPFLHFTDFGLCSHEAIGFPPMLQNGHEPGRAGRTDHTPALHEHVGPAESVEANLPQAKSEKSSNMWVEKR